jgi:hypothetical protein
MEVRLGWTKTSKTGAWAVIGAGWGIRAKRTVGGPCRARVYPQQLPYLNLVAFSNIEPYSMTQGRSGTKPRSFFLRISLGNPLTMQPISKPAQSMSKPSILTRSPRQRIRARSFR